MRIFDAELLAGTEESLDFIENVLEASTQYSIVAADLDGVIALWNRGAQLLYGYTPEQVIGRMKIEELHVARDRDAGLPAQIIEVARREGTWEGTLERQRRDGTTFTARMVMTPRFTGRGDHAGFLFISKDVTNETRLADELEATQWYTRSLIESNIDALMTTDPVGIITDVNQQMESLTGYARDELIGSPFKNYFTDPDLADEGIRLVLHEGRVTNYELTARAKDGRTTVVSYNATTLTDRDGRLRGVFAAARDVSDLKAIQEEAQRASLAKTEFLSRMSHELRTPLNAVNGFAELLAMGDLDPDQREAVGHILRGGEHLLQLINEILDIARIEAGKLRIDLQPVHVASAVDAATELIAPVAAERNVTITTALGLERDEMWIWGDGQRIRQVLLNLLSNAVKYNNAGGRVTIAVTRAGSGRLRIAVMDTGIGIGPENRARLFRPFERLVQENGFVEGTGIGLALTKRLVEAQGGDIGFESTLGEGSTFWVELEAAPPAFVQGAAGKNGQVREDLEVGTVVYIEDSAANRALIERMFRERFGVTVHSAATAAEGIELVRSLGADLVLLDLHLPDAHGSDVLSRMKDDPATARIPVIVVSADATHQQVAAVVEAGAARYVTKPINIASLVTTVAEVVAGKPFSRGSGTPGVRGTPAAEEAAP